MTDPHRVVAAAGAALLLLLAPASTANPLEPPRPELVFTGNGPTTATFTLRKPAKFHLTAASLSMSGSYGGVYIVSTSGVRYGGVLRIRALDTYDTTVPLVSQPPTPLPGAGGPRPTLPPGSYRAYLLGDGVTDVRLSLEEGEGQVVRTTAPSLQALHTQESQVPADVENDPDNFVMSYRLNRPANTFSVLVGQFTSESATTGTTVRACFSRDSGCQPAGPGEPLGVMRRGMTVQQALGLGPDRNGGAWYGIVDVATRLNGGGRARLAYFHVRL